MTRVLFLLLGFFIYGPKLTAQAPFNLTVTPAPSKEDKYDRVVGIVGSREEGVCAIYSDKSKTTFCIKKLNNENKLVQTQVLPADMKDVWWNAYRIRIPNSGLWVGNDNTYNALDPLSHFPDGFFRLGGKYYMMGLSKKEKQFVAYEIDVKQGKIKLPKKIVLTTEPYKYIHAKRVFVSADGQRLWIIQGDPNAKKKLARLVYVFDSGLKLVKKMTIDFDKVSTDYAETSPDLKLISITDNGEDLFYLCHDNSLAENKLQIYKLKEPKPELIAQFSVDKIEKFDFDEHPFKMIYHNRQFIICGEGIFKNNDLNKAFFICKTSGGDKTEVLYYGLDKEVASRYNDNCRFQKAHEKLAPHDDDIYFKDFQVDPGTDELIVRCHTRHMEDRSYHYGSIYVCAINLKDNSVKYFTKIPYCRPTMDDWDALESNEDYLFNTHKYFRANHKDYFFYNDSKGNAKIIDQENQSPDCLKYSKDGVDVVVVVDEKGNLKKYQTGLSEGASDRVYRFWVQVADNEFIGHSESGQLVVFRFN